MPDRVLLPVLRVTPAAAKSLNQAGERLGVSTAAVVELLARYAVRLGEKDVARLPDGFRGRRGAGRRKKAGQGGLPVG